MEKELKYSEKLLRECRDLSDVFLGPILSKRELSRRVKGCSPTLRKLATYIDYPPLMQKAFEREDFEEVVSIVVSRQKKKMIHFRQSTSPPTCRRLDFYRDDDVRKLTRHNPLIALSKADIRNV